MIDEMRNIANVGSIHSERVLWVVKIKIKKVSYSCAVISFSASFRLIVGDNLQR